MSALYLREYSAAVRRDMNATGDLFSEHRFKVLGIQRGIQKLNAALIIDLETLSAHELEQMRVEIARQIFRRKAEQQPKPMTVQQ